MVQARRSGRGRCGRPTRRYLACGCRRRRRQVSLYSRADGNADADGGGVRNRVMEYWSAGRMDRNRKVVIRLISFCIWLTPLHAYGQTKSIIIGEGVRGAMYLPAYIAEEIGFFKRRELDTRMVTFSRSNDINALVSGDIQFDLTAPDKVVHSALGGFPVKMVMGTARGLNLALTVHPSIRS